MRKRQHSRSFVQRGAPTALLAASLLVCAGPVAALEFEIGDIPFKIDNLVTVGAMLRTQDRDSGLIAKPNYTPGLCLTRDSGTPDAGPSQTGNSYTSGQIPLGCATNNTPAITEFVAAPGSFSPNGDNGNLNFDRGDIVHAAAKITTDLNTEIFGFNIFARGLYYFDNEYSNLVETRPDTTLSARHYDFPDAGKDAIGSDFRMLDYFISRNFELGDRQFVIKLGNQVVNWGESAFLIPNSLNSINPPDQALLRMPGFDIKELFQPVGMAFIAADLFRGASLEAFYQYEWKPVVADPVGSFFSQSDILGDGGFMAMLSFSRAPEDPGYAIDDPRYPAGRRGFYRAIDTCGLNPGGSSTDIVCVDGAGLLGSSSSRTIFRDKAEEQRRLPDDGGQYGAALKLFLEGFNGGTELGFYYANYHSRFPVVSAFAALDTCIVDQTSFAPVIGDCGYLGPGTAAGEEPLPVDTVRLIVEYPENVEMFGVSFNTTVGDWALAGEYTYRPKLPMQVHSTDLLFAALQPAFPEEDVSLGITTIPGRRSAVPDFLMQYRGRPAGQVAPGEYIRGYELMKQGQADVTLLKTIGGDNMFGASQIVVLLELGHTFVFDFPDLSELQFNGAGTDTHISSGADGSFGINPADVRCTGGTGCNQGALSAQTSRQNPTTHRDLSGFGTEESYGYRFVTLTRFDDAIFGINLELLNAFFHDVEGVGPGIGQNFVEGRKSILSGVRFDYLSKWNGEIRYTWFTGGGDRDQLRDRDNLLVFLGYQF
jgi:hypothetical protein